MKLYRLTGAEGSACYFADTPAEALDLAIADGFTDSTHIQDVSKNHPEIVTAATDVDARGRGEEIAGEPGTSRWRIGDKIVS